MNYHRSHEPDTDGTDTNRMQRKNMRPLKAMNISEEIEEKCDRPSLVHIPPSSDRQGIEQIDPF